MSNETQKDLEIAEKKTIEKIDGEPTREGIMFQPSVDIIEDAGSIILFADLPGVKKDAVDIDVREGVLTLSATVDMPPESWQPVLREYQLGGFGRRFSLSEKIDTQKITANLEHGVLRLELPKVAEHKPRKIAIS